MQISVSCGITGFENPTLPFRQELISLTQLFVHSPASSRIVVCPERYADLGIEKGDWLLVDASLTPSMTDLVLVSCIDDLSVVSWSVSRQHFSKWEDDAVLVGVVTLSIHHFRPPSRLPDHESLSDLDLHSLLVTQEYSTLFLRADGCSMLPFVHNGDILILERHLDVAEHDAVVLALNHDLVMKRVDRSRSMLYSDNPKYPPYIVGESDYLRLHGVVSRSLRLHRDLSCTH